MDCKKIASKVLHKALCLVGLHNHNRTENFGERACSHCGGSYWGNVVYGSEMRYLGNWRWYSASDLAQIQRLGEMNDLRNGLGRFGQAEVFQADPLYFIALVIILNFMGLVAVAAFMLPHPVNIAPTMGVLCGFLGALCWRWKYALDRADKASQSGASVLDASSSPG